MCAGFLGLSWVSGDDNWCSKVIILEHDLNVVDSIIRLADGLSGRGVCEFSSRALHEVFKCTSIATYLSKFRARAQRKTFYHVDMQRV